MQLRRDEERNRYVLVAGLHRLQAVRALGEDTIEALSVHARRRQTFSRAGRAERRDGCGIVASDRRSDARGGARPPLLTRCCLRVSADCR